MSDKSPNDCTDTGTRHGCRCRACRERETAKREHDDGRADYERDTMMDDEREELR